MEEKNIIPMNEPLRSFKEFLDQENNKRVFLSGKFGSGKTFFLDKFFKKNSAHYDVYHLFPIKYQILENEDVINLIKYDILVSIFEKGPELPEAKLEERIKSFSKYLNWEQLLDAVPKLGRQLLLAKGIYTAWVKAKSNPAQQELEAFQEMTKGKLANSIDILLHQQIQKLKGATKRSVLVLDDLDRMDPEHIFRMLNILSAKMELDDENELGFDHVILAGDIENIQHIFHHKYGQQTDFQGYFDKFSTVQPYAFDNIQATVNWIESKIIKSIHHHASLKTSVGTSGWIRIPLEELLKQLVKVKALNLRQLYKPVKHSLPNLSTPIPQEPLDKSTNAAALHLNRCLELLISLFEGSRKQFVTALEHIRDQLPKANSKPFKEKGLNYPFYSFLWEIINPQETPDSLEEVTHRMFYDNLIQHVNLHCRDGLHR